MQSLLWKMYKNTHVDKSTFRFIYHNIVYFNRFLFIIYDETIGNSLVLPYM